MTSDVLVPSTVLFNGLLFRAAVNPGGFFSALFAPILNPRITLVSHLSRSFLHTVDFMRYVSYGMRT